MTTRHVPHELSSQTAIHTCWPAAEDLWEDYLEPAQTEFGQFLTLLADAGPQASPLPLVVYAASEQAEASAKALLPAHARIVPAPYGDVWLRDTGPVFVKAPDGLKAVRFRFNGWGGKYELAGDETIGSVAARQAGTPLETIDLICEGGALEFDGEGTCLTTRQCVLNSNRNPGLTEAGFEQVMAEHFGVQKVIWIDEGLMGDHTDGHVDNIARFAGPGRVVIQTASGNNDPNSQVFKDIFRQLTGQKDAVGRPLEIIEIPSPGLVEIDGEPAAASHMNWVIGRRNVVIPAYNDRAEEAARILRVVFRSHQVEPSPAEHILTGGGAFHCVTCNQPAS